MLTGSGMWVASLWAAILPVEVEDGVCLCDAGWSSDVGSPASSLSDGNEYSDSLRGVEASYSSSPGSASPGWLEPLVTRR